MKIINKKLFQAIHNQDTLLIKELVNQCILDVAYKTQNQNIIEIINAFIKTQEKTKLEQTTYKQQNYTKKVL